MIKWTESRPFLFIVNGKYENSDLVHIVKWFARLEAILPSSFIATPVRLDGERERGRESECNRQFIYNSKIIVIMLLFCHVAHLFKS
jgi:hypothetical protein